ncbi:VOC family protein [Actinomadura sp. 9N215]|uniref:VOC family protein n=1 Tax=Actinomadura sp. 9N215 TaxID=3375150 RepID=UPI0037B26B4D
MPAARPTKLGHLVLQVRDIHKSVEFYTEIVGLTVSDWIADQMVFLRCGPDHHDLGLAQLPPEEAARPPRRVGERAGLEHFSYEVGGLAELEAAADFLAERDVEIVRGIGKHGPGENLFLVFLDPDGNYVEFYADMVKVDDEHPHQAQVWDDTVEAYDQWRFERFRVPAPALYEEKAEGRP